MNPICFFAIIGSPYSLPLLQIILRAAECPHSWLHFLKIDTILSTNNSWSILISNCDEAMFPSEVGQLFATNKCDKYGEFCVELGSVVNFLSFLLYSNHPSAMLGLSLTKLTPMYSFHFWDQISSQFINSVFLLS